MNSSEKRTRTGGISKPIYFGIFLAVILVAVKWFFGTGWQKPDFEIPVYGEVPGFELTDQTGSFLKNKDLQGKVWIAGFFFTRCAGPCPLLTGQMKIIGSKFQGNPGFRMVSFSVDPETDTPQVLSKYAEKYEADPKLWYFLTGSREQIYTLTESGFRLGVRDIPEPEREAPDQTVQHSTKLVLVDSLGRIRGYYDSESQGALDRLSKNVQKLLAEN